MENAVRRFSVTPMRSVSCSRIRCGGIDCPGVELRPQLFIDFEKAKVQDSDRLSGRISIGANPAYHQQRLRKLNIFGESAETFSEFGHLIYGTANGSHGNDPTVLQDRARPGRGFQSISEGNI